MKKGINKKVISITLIIVIMATSAGMFYIKNKSNKPEGGAPIAATVRKATFGSALNVILSDLGKEQYKGAVKYQVYYEGQAITQKEEIGIPTTAFPARKENEKVVVKLLKADDKEVYSVDLNLQKEENAK